MQDKLITALMPFWLIGLGAAVGLFLVLCAWCLLCLVYRNGAVRMWELARETVVMPVLVVACLSAAYTGTTTLLDAAGFHFFPQKRAALNSLVRLHTPANVYRTYLVQAGQSNFPVELEVAWGEFRYVEIESNRPLTVTLNGTFQDVLGGEDRIPLLGNEAWSWSRGRELNPPFDKEVHTLYLTNPSADPARVELYVATDVLVPQVAVVPWTAGGLLAFVLVYWLLQTFVPKTMAVALTTGKEATAQPLFYLLLGIGTIALLAFVVVPYHTFGEDVKVLKENGMEIIKVLAIIVALWTASVAVAEEIEGRTALTVLSKPIGRVQFILGKYLGICGPVAVMFVLLGVLFLFCVSYKVLYDAREGGAADVTWIDCHREAITCMPGMTLAFMEACLLAAISVAISTRLPMLPNLLICVTIYALGHMVPMLVNSAQGQLEFVQFVGQLFALVLPQLDHFNIKAAIAGGTDVPLVYLGLVMLYSLVYISVVMLVALALFEDRDLA